MDDAGFNITASLLKNVAKQGVLLKKSGGFFGGIKEKYVVVSANVLFVYTDASSPRAKRVILLDDAAVTPCSLSPKYPHGFCIRARGAVRDFLFGGESEVAVAEWIEAIKGAMYKDAREVDRVGGVHSTASVKKFEVFMGECKQLLAPFVSAVKVALVTVGSGERQAALDANVDAAASELRILEETMASMGENDVLLAIRRLLDAHSDAREIMEEQQGESDSLRRQLEEFAKTSRDISENNSVLDELKARLLVVTRERDMALEKEVSQTQKKQVAAPPPPIPPISSKTPHTSPSDGGSVLTAVLAHTHPAQNAFGVVASQAPPPPPPNLTSPPLVTTAPSSPPPLPSHGAMDSPSSHHDPWAQILATARNAESRHECVKLTPNFFSPRTNALTRTTQRSPPPPTILIFQLSGCPGSFC